MLSHTTILVSGDPGWLPVATALATWLAAIGTVGTALMSIYLAREPYRVKLRVGAGKRLTFYMGEPVERHREVLMIDVTNIGLRTVNVSAIGWELGGRFRSKKYFYQVITPGPDSAPFPCTLNQGERQTWSIPLQPWIERWGEHKESPQYDASTLRLAVFTTYGTKHYATPEQALIDQLKQDLERKVQQREPSV